MRLAALKDLGIRVRVAAALRPKTEPDVGGWAEDVDPLTDETVAEIKRTSTLDRSFLTRSPLTWGGAPSESASDHRGGLGGCGADSASFSPKATAPSCPRSKAGIWFRCRRWGPTSVSIGTSSSAISVEEGPAPDHRCRYPAQRAGPDRSNVVNSSVFRSAITGFGNWVQIELLAGSLVATSRGDFDRVILGSMERGEWRPESRPAVPMRFDSSKLHRPGGGDQDRVPFASPRAGARCGSGGRSRFRTDRRRYGGVVRVTLAEADQLPDRRFEPLRCRCASDRLSRSSAARRGRSAAPGGGISARNRFRGDRQTPLRDRAR